jgi:hypothetical protein
VSVVCVVVLVLVVQAGVCSGGYAGARCALERVERLVFRQGGIKVGFIGYLDVCGLCWPDDEGEN